MAGRFFWYFVAALTAACLVATVHEKAAREHRVTPLMQACLMANVEQVEQLLRQGVSPNERSLHPYYQFDQMPAKGFEQKPEYPIVSSVTGSAQSEWIYGPFGSVRATDEMKKRLEIVELLCRYHANLNVKANSGDRYLFRIASESLGYRTLKVLIEHGMDLKRRDSDGRTALHLLCDDLDNRHSGSHYRMAATKKIAQLLLRAGCPVDCRDKYGRTPLYYAAMNGNTPACEVLLAFGANPRAKDIAGMNPTDVAYSQKIINLLSGKNSATRLPDRSAF